jgi:hypothetical protein
MHVRMMRSRLWAASLLVGLGLLTVSCGASTPAHAVPSATLTPLPSPTATIAPTATTTSAAAAGCNTSSSSSTHFENPPGPLPTALPIPPGTLVPNQSLGINGVSAAFYFCTPGATPAAITAYMDAALPAAGWTSTSPQCSAHFPPGLWYKGNYGIEIVVAGFSPPDKWAVDLTCLSRLGC